MILPDLLEQLSGEWSRPLSQAGAVLTPPLAGLQVNTNSDSASMTKFLIFNAGQSQPSLVAKWARTSSAQLRLIHEYHALNELWTISALQSTIPKPLGYFEWDEDLVLVEAGLPGAPLSILLQRRERNGAGEIEHDLFRAQVWLHLLQTATSLGVIQFAGRYEVERRVELLHQAGLRRGDFPPAFLERLYTEADDFQQLYVPIVGQHSDFQPSKFLLDTHQVGVIDWENFTRGAQPWADVFHFAIELVRAHAGSRSRWPASRESFHLAFVQQNWLSNLIVGYVNRYLRAMHLPEDAAYLFFALFLMDMAAQHSPYHLAPAAGRSSGWMQTLQTYLENASGSIFASDSERTVVRPGATSGAASASESLPLSPADYKPIGSSS